MPVRGAIKRRSRKKEQTHLLAAVFLSTAAVFAVFLINARHSSTVEAASAPPIVVGQFDTVLVPVPAEPVPAGTQIKEIRFKNVSFPQHQLPEGAITKIQDYIDFYTASVLPANLPLFRSNLVGEQHGVNPVVERIPAGMRAMTVKVDATAAVEGWAGSGSHVDVLLVEKNRTTVVAEMVKILSAERSVSPVEGSAAPNVPSTVTLLVTQEQCLAINTAIPLGKIAFALRSTDDKERWTSTSFTAESLKGGSVIKDKRGVITGYVSSDDRNNKRSFALTDGHWIETEIVPEGFLVSKLPKKESIN